MPVQGRITFDSYQNMGAITYGKTPIGAVYYGTKLIWQKISDSSVVETFDIGGSDNSYPAARIHVDTARIMSFSVFVTVDQVVDPMYAVICQITDNGVKTVASIGNNLEYSGCNPSKYVTDKGAIVYEVKVAATDQTDGIPVDDGIYYFMIGTHAENQYAHNKIVLADNALIAQTCRVEDYSIPTMGGTVSEDPFTMLDVRCLLDIKTKDVFVDDPISRAVITASFDPIKERISIDSVICDGFDVSGPSFVDHYEYTFDGVTTYTTSDITIPITNMDFSDGSQKTISIIAVSCKDESVKSPSTSLSFGFDISMNIDYIEIDRILTWDIKNNGVDYSENIEQYSWSDDAGHSGATGYQLLSVESFDAGDYILSIQGITTNNNKLMPVSKSFTIVKYETYHSVNLSEGGTGVWIDYSPSTDVVLVSYTSLAPGGYYSFGTTPASLQIREVDSSNMTAPTKICDLKMTETAAETPIRTVEDDKLFSYTYAPSTASSVTLYAGHRYILGTCASSNQYNFMGTCSYSSSSTNDMATFSFYNQEEDYTHVVVSSYKIDVKFKFG